MKVLFLFPGQPCRGDVHLVGQFRQVVVGLGNGRGAEGVGLDEVGTGLQVLLVDFLDDVGSGEREQLVVALDIAREVFEALAPVLRLVQLEALNHGAHGPIQNDQALAQSDRQVLSAEAVDILKNCNHNKKKKFQYLIDEWGVDLQSEHERYLVEKHFGCPVILYDYPAKIKAFYMRLNEDGKTVRYSDRKSVV